MGNNGITDALAAYAAEMSYEKLDPETIRVQKYSLLDAIACMAAATGVEGDWNRFAEFAVSQGTGECSLIGRNEKVSPSMAALANGALDCAIAGTPERAGAVWSVRGGILEGMKADSVAQEECDVVVPRARIAEYVKAAKKIASAHGIRVEPCGHCGDGNIHTEMLRGPEMSDEEWKAATHASLTELYALSKELGGQLSGEHGIGNGRLEFLEEFVGPRMIQLYKSIKLAFDDKLILNPGKVIEFNK